MHAATRSTEPEFDDFLIRTSEFALIDPGSVTGDVFGTRFVDCGHSDAKANRDVPEVDFVENLTISTPGFVRRRSRRAAPRSGAAAR